MLEPTNWTIFFYYQIPSSFPFYYWPNTFFIVSTFCHCLHIFSIKKATIYFNRVGKDDLVGYLGIRGLSIPISLEIDAEVNNERVRATCLPIIMPAVVVVVSQETTLHKFKLQSFPPFLTPVVNISHFWPTKSII